AARQERQRTLLEAGRMALRKGRVAEGTRHFPAACGDGFIHAERVRAVRLAARLLETADRPGDAIGLWLSGLADPLLRSTPLIEANAPPRRSAAVAVREIDRLLKKDPRKAKWIETEAQQRLNAAGDEERSAVVEWLAEELPNAAVTRTALRESA